MENANSITIFSNKMKEVLDINSILYVIMKRNNAEIHVNGDKVYTARMALCEIEEQLGDGFITVRRGCLVSVMAIYDVKDRIYLCNGESLRYVVRKKKAVRALLSEKQKKLIAGFNVDGIPKTEEEYRNHYRSFEHLPFAFTDIEMVFNEEKHAVDWIFRYGNEALAKLEKQPIEKLIGSSFGALFKNVDPKWLRSYERATLYGDMLEIIDYSPEIDTYLKVICFPTFKGHCGCILFNIEEIEFARNSCDAEKALMLYFGKLPGRN